MKFFAAVFAFVAFVALPAQAADASHVQVKTSKGVFVFELNAEAAPKTVANFLQYVEDGHYQRSIFHRVVKGFVVQGGGYSQYFNERPTRDPVPYEGDNGLSNVRGTIAMARTRNPNSATAQWYVNLKDNTNLDHLENDIGVRPGYTVFGKVVDGLEVIDAIGAVETGEGGPFPAEVPQETILIESVEVVDWPQTDQ
ncbi:MAG: peptidylprolyl isomerase [Pseudomonadota bacterium]